MKNRKSKAVIAISFVCMTLSSAINMLLFARDYHKYKNGEF